MWVFAEFAKEIKSEYLDEFESKRVNIFSG
jgi:hypothetical protein